MQFTEFKYTTRDTFTTAKKNALKLKLTAQLQMTMHMHMIARDRADLHASISAARMHAGTGGAFSIAIAIDDMEKTVPDLASLHAGAQRSKMQDRSMLDGDLSCTGIALRTACLELHFDS
jgi:hypothetical protein